MYCSYCGGRLPAPVPTRCPSCGVAHYRNSVPCAGVVIIRHNAVLLVQRSNQPFAGAWDIPGGFCEEKEHPRDAARREVDEELGVTVTIRALVGMWLEDYKPAIEQPLRTTLNIYYLATVVEPCTPRATSTEVKDVAWFPRSPLPEPLAFPRSTRPALEASFALLDRV